MAEYNEPVSFVDLAIVMKYLDPNMKLSEAQIRVSELKKCVSDMLNLTHRPSLAIADENSLAHGLSLRGTAKEQIQAVIDYKKSHPPLKNFNYYESVYTSPHRIVNELLEAKEGNLDYRKAAKSRNDCDISALSQDVILLAAQTFMFRNKHYNVSDEEALQAFHSAIQYLKGEQRTSVQFIKCDSRELTEIIRCVNRYFIEESIDLIGLEIVKKVMDSINQGTEPPKPDGFMFSWDVHLLSKVDCLSFDYSWRNLLFEKQSDDYIFPVWESMGQNCYRWYIFRARGKYSGKDFYTVQLKKTTTIEGIHYEFEGDFRASENPDVLKRFQDGKINGNCTIGFQGTSAYSWSRDGKPPAHPYFILAQLYWPRIPLNSNYKLEQITDKVALSVLYDEIPALEEKTTTDFKTYTWFLNKPENAVNNFPELKDYSEGQMFSDDYLRPSTEPLKTDGFTYEWSREEHESTHQDFTLIFRARPTCERVPQVITGDTRIRLDYWQYIKEFVFFGGSRREGAVIAPDPAWIDQAHRNGVAIFGTVFLPPLTNGGVVKDLEELAKLENLQKLVDIAHRLNFEGWFLNTESYESYREPLLNTLKLTIQKMDLRGKQMIWYLPNCEQTKNVDPEFKGVRMTCDDKVNNTAFAFLEEEGKKLHLNFYKLVDQLFSYQAPRNYLMFVDEPYWVNTLKHRQYLVDPIRFPYAQKCLWQFFLGENGLERNPTDTYRWYGIAKYAKQRK